MVFDRALSRCLSSLALTSAVIDALRRAGTPDDLTGLMEAITRALTFRHYALIHHDDLSSPRGDLVDIRDYPSAIAERLIGERRYEAEKIVALIVAHFVARGRKSRIGLVRNQSFVG